MVDFYFYKSILLSDSTSELSARAVYSLAYFYDLIYSNADSALKYYELLQSYHSESEQAVVSKQRLLAINNIFNDSSEAENDSLEIEEKKAPQKIGKIDQGTGVCLIS